MIRYHLHRALGVEHSSLLSSENPKFWYTVPIFCMGGNGIFLGFLTEVAKYFRRLTARCHKTGGKRSTCRLIATEWNTVSGSTVGSRTILPSRTNSLELSFQIGKFWMQRLTQERFYEIESNLLQQHKSHITYRNVSL